MRVCLRTGHKRTGMHTSGVPLLLFSLGAQPLTGRQCKHSKQRAGPLNWPLARSRRQVVVAKRTDSVSAQWAHCGPQAAALQDMSSASLCQYWPICALSHDIHLRRDVRLFLTDNTPAGMSRSEMISGFFFSTWSALRFYLSQLYTMSLIVFIFKNGNKAYHSI